MKTNNTIKSYLKKHISNIENKRLLLCVSGGIDSVYMYHQMKDISIEKGFSVAIAHVNYNTSDYSRRCTELCRNLALENNHPFYIKDVKLDPSNFEHNAREVRYKFFHSIKEKERYDYILTAHNRDDLIETLYMQNISSNDFSAIPLNQEHNAILRPLISITREEIEEQVKDKGYSFYKDPTNRDIKYKRNKVRHEILPNLKNKDRIIQNLLASYKEKVEMYGSFMDSLNLVKEKNIKEEQRDVYINREYLKTLDLYSFKLLLQGAIKDVYNTLPLKSEKYWMELHSLVLSDKVSILKKIDDNLTLYFENDNIIVSLVDDSDVCKRLNQKTRWMDYSFSVEKYNTQKNEDSGDKKVFICPMSMLKEGLYVRKRQNGDKYSLSDKKSKNISDLLNEKKVSVSKRDNFPILLYKEKIQWVPGLAHASNNHLKSSNLVKITVDRV